VARTPIADAWFFNGRYARAIIAVSYFCGGAQHKAAPLCPFDVGIEEGL
jgi:hypothetical protein